MKNHYPKIFLLLLTIFTTSILQAAPFIGTYVVGLGETYTSLNSILSAMATEGTSGHCTIKIKNGTYIENVYGANISTLAETATLTIESNSGNATDVILRSSTSYAVYLYNLKHVKFQNLSIIQAVTNRCVYLYNAENITFNNCIITGTTSTSSTSSYATIYLTSKCDNFKMDKCTISEGSYGMYSTSTMKNMLIENTSFDAHYYGAQIYYVNNLIFRNNTMSNINSYGLYLYQITDLDINNNNISANSYNYVQNCKTTTSGRAVFYNNIFYSSGSYGMRLSSTNTNLEFYHNTFLSNGSYGFYISSTTIDMKFKNNLVASNNCTYAMRINSGNTQNAEIDYNAYSNSSPNCNPFYNGNSINFEEWKAQTGYDMNSVYGQANFVSFPTNPKPQNGLFVNVCNPISGITKDINGVNRDNTNPDPGALEFNSIYSNDMALLSLNSLLAPNCSSSDDIIVNVKNIGLNAVASFKLEYKVNGNLIGTYNHSTSIPAYGSEVLTIGSYAFDGDDDSLELAITDVNGGADADLSNNALPLFRIYDALTGTVTIGENDTLKGIKSLFDQISNGGICGEVHIKIRDGNYEGYEDVYLANVRTSSEDDRLFIESESGNAEDVVLRTRSNWNNGVLDFEDVNNITVQNLTLDANFNTCNPGINFEGTCSNIELRNLIVLGDSSHCGDIFQFDNGIQNLIIDNCYTTNGSEVVDLYLNEGSPYIFEFTNNTIMNFEDDFMYVEGYKNVLIHNNRIESNQPGNEGIYLYENGQLTVTNNIMILDSCDNSGFDIEYHYGSKPSIVANNYLNITGGDAWTAVYLYENPALHFTNNTIVSNVDFDNNSNYGSIYIEDYPLASFTNNIVVNNNDDIPVIYVYEFPTFVMDNNNYIGAGTIVYYDWNEDLYLDLAEWQAETGKDLASMSVDPMFHGAMDFHVCNPALDGAGRSVGFLPADIDGDTRFEGSTDIGADEFSPAGTGDFMVSEGVSLCNGAAELIASPGANSYSWSTGATSQKINVTEPGTYTVSVDGICGDSGMDSVRVSDDTLQARFGYAFTYGRNFSFYDRSLGFPNAYRWDFGDGEYSSEMNPSHLYASTGFYTVKLTIWSDCGMETISEDVSIFNVGIDEVESKLLVYPNPTEGSVTIRIDSYTGSFDASVVDMTGKEVLSLSNISSSSAIDLSQLTTGFYFLKVKTEDNVIQTKVYKM